MLASAPTAAQSNRHFVPSPRTALVGMEVVRAFRGVEADAINELVDAGKLRWVWDLSTGRKGRIRALRFWLNEIIAPEATRQLAPAAVVRAVLGTDRTRWRGVELAQLLLVSRPHIFKLRKSKAIGGEIVHGTLFVARPVVEKFLTQRLVNT